MFPFPSGFVFRLLTDTGDGGGEVLEEALLLPDFRFLPQPLPFSVGTYPRDVRAHLCSDAVGESRFLYCVRS